MTVDILPGRDYDAAMAAIAAQARANTHIIVATSRVTGESRSQHARPHDEAVACRDEWRINLGTEWVVKAVSVRGWLP